MSSPIIYKEGWICLNPSCKQFWMLETAIGLLPLPPGFSLTYSLAFGESFPSPAGMQRLPYEVRPTPPVNPVILSSMKSISAGMRTLWKGILNGRCYVHQLSGDIGWVCGECGRANCRYRWEVWVSPLICIKATSFRQSQGMPKLRTADGTLESRTFHPR